MEKTVPAASSSPPSPPISNSDCPILSRSLARSCHPRGGGGSASTRTTISPPPTRRTVFNPPRGLPSPTSPPLSHLRLLVRKNRRYSRGPGKPLLPIVPAFYFQFVLFHLLAPPPRADASSFLGVYWKCGENGCKKRGVKGRRRRRDGTRPCARVPAMTRHIGV